MERTEVIVENIAFFWRWWDEAEHKSTPEKRLAFYDALMRYIFLGEVPEDPKTKENPTGADWAAYDATHYFDVIDSLVQGATRRRRGAQPGNSNALKLSLLPVGFADGEEEKKDESNEERSEEENEEKRKTKRKDDSLYNQELKIKNQELKNNITPKPPAGDVRTAAKFEKFWQAYPRECPRKVDKQRCIVKFAKILRDAEDPEAQFAEIMAGLEKWRRSDTWLRDGGQYIRGPLTWLNNASWLDEPKAAAESASGGGNDPVAAARAEARAYAAAELAKINGGFGGAAEGGAK